MKKGTLLILGLVLLLSSGCEKNENIPEIAWQTGARISYSYSNGVLSGFNAVLKFIVINDLSGEIEFSAKLFSDERKCTGFVEPGQEYTVSVRCSISSTGKEGSVFVDSPSVAEPFEISSEYKIHLASITL